MKKYTLLVFILLLGTFASAQKLTKKAQENATKLEAEIAKYKASGEKELVSENLRELGFIYYSSSNYSKAILFFKEAITYTTSSNNKANINVVIANNYDAAGNPQEALVHVKKGLKYTDKAGNKSLMYSKRLEIADRENSLQKYNEAIATLQETIKLSIELGNSKFAKKTIRKIIKNYKALGDGASITKYEKVLRKNDIEEIANALSITTEKKRTNSEVAAVTDKFMRKIMDSENMNKELRDSLMQQWSDIEFLEGSVTILSDTLNAKQEDLQQTEKDLEKKLSELSTLDTYLKEKDKVLTGLIAIIALIVILAFFAMRGYFVKKKQHKLLDIQNREISSQAELLNNKNAELSKTLKELQEAQHQLVQSEKMASLGQLIAGIAHELNTPLGAIKSSIGTVIASSDESLRRIPALVKSLSDANLAIFIKILEQGAANTGHFTSREERKIKKGLRADLEAENIENSDDIADNLIDMAVHSIDKSYFELFKLKNAPEIMQTGYYIAAQKRNSMNIQTAVERAAKIIFALKSFTRSGTEGVMSTASIPNNIETVLTIYNNQLKQGIEVVKNFQPVPDIKCFAEELSQVWTNLIHNATQAMENKGILTLGVFQEGKEIVISIKDNGSGIPEDIQPRVFEPFFTTRAAGEGTGLGLDIVRKIIERHGGTINFETEAGKGTTFFVKLPV